MTVAVGYPEHWEADVVLRDGGTAHLRPIRPEDASAVQDFHVAQSEESIYLRFFAPLPRLPKRDLERFTNVDHRDRVAFVVTIGEQIVGIGRYDRIDEKQAEVAFNIADSHQSRGLGSVLLEHLAAAARERGIRQFRAEVLPQNSAMLKVFTEAGYEVTRRFDDGVVDVHFDVDPTDRSRAVMESREHRAEALSVFGLLHPKSVVVIGASRKRDSTGNLLLRNLTEAGFGGDVYVVHPEAEHVAGHPAYRTLQDLPGPADIAVIAVPADAVTDVVRSCAAHGVKGVVVISSGFAETGPAGLALQRGVVRTARSNGMRVVGPNSFGLLNTDPDVRLNASLAPFLPPAGNFGLFSQSGALGIAVLASAARRGLGVSSFVSAGNRADLSGNDLMQYWEEDDNTRAVGLYLESIGNPRKFSRIARRLARSKPVVVVKSDITGQELPPGHAVRVSPAGAGALDEMLKQAGVIRADSIHRLFDVAQLVTNQPLPSGPRVGVIGNSAALGTLVVQGLRAKGLRVGATPVSLHPEASDAQFREALEEIFRSDLDSVVVTFTPSVGASERDVASALAEIAAGSGKTTVACFLGVHGVSEQLSATTTSDGEVRTLTVPAYPSPEDAVWALAATTGYAQWRTRDHGNYVNPEGLQPRRARRLVTEWLAGTAPGEPVRLDSHQVHELLDCYGLTALPSRRVTNIDEAVQAANFLGYPVALKSVDDNLRHRIELGGVRLNIDDDAELLDDYLAMQRTLTPLVEADQVALEVQPMAPNGVACVVRSGEDPLFGPVVSFSLAGDATELLGDVAHRISPLTDSDISDLIRSVRASPRLFGYRGLPPAHTGALEDLLARVSVLADQLPEVAELLLNPVVAALDGVYPLSAEIVLQANPDRNDSPRRKLA
ncbi:bifunctional GNAT family N-acetyltransferase/acetate--CoA ligase family protein [Saxibacter everestensis]|uniref:Bifunctional GNAT family N-acetyltransferase/acetate--CoA ligase family protein n=1 Tax=Saxibacter everestensis TaxID=2909229 RepID=A0ABY8QRF6_9MICO|nr:bifunctional GNAT family N-acetyltransferase/acetate--CoA ligase family protein [Brevibacteriaceae bacterium ZFBP1038]